jgi:hypothetical protein
MATDQDEQRREAEDFLLKAALISLIKQEMPDEEDENRALRRLILTLIWAVQDEATPATQYLIDYLLLEFPPLVKHFDERHRHPLVHGEDVMRARLDDDRVGLLIREAFGRQLLEEAIEVVEEAEE